MALWGKNDVASNSMLYVNSQVKQAANSSNQTALFGNTSAWYGKSEGKQVAGVFAVDSTEVRVGSGPIAIAKISNPGSGYAANAAVTITVTNGGTSGVVNAHANTSTGKIDALNISTAGSGYKTNPTIAIAAPDVIVFNGNTAVSANAIALTSANSKFQAGDKVTYAGNTLSTPVGLTDGGTYFVSFANTTVIKLATKQGGANLTISAAAGDTATAGGATVRGETATGYVAVGGGENKGVTAGWNLRTAGTGGRAGRIQNECLVSMRNITGDASDDTILPDA